MKYLFILISLFGTKSFIRACSCIPPGLPKVEFEKCDLVTVGRVVAIKKFDDYTNEFTILITRYYKGKPENDTLILMSESHTGVSCGYPFETGKEYVIYAFKRIYTKYYKDDRGKIHRKEKKRYYTHICTRTKPIDEASVDLDYLNALKN